MKKRLVGILLAVIIVVLTVSLSSAAPLPGTGYWFGATHQNVGDANATLVVTAYGQTTGQYTWNPAALAPGASLNVGPNDIPGLPAGFIGSIVTSSDQPLVALVNVTNRPAGSFGDPAGRAAAIYSGVDGANASTSLSFPLAKHNHFNKTTTFYLQNAGTADATISVVFTVNGVDYPYNTPSVAPGRMVAVDPGTASVPNGNGNVGSMTLTSAQPIAGAMLEHEHSAAVGTVLQGSSGFSPAEQGNTAYCPAVKKHHFGRSSGLQVQNAHNAAQTITVTYIASNGTPYVSADPDLTNLAAGASTTLLDDPILPQGVTLVAATIEGASGPVSAIVNESELPLVNPVQTSTTYNCQAASTASTTLSYPAYKEGWFGRSTAIQIQNVGAADASVTMSFTDNLGNVRTTNAQTINDGASSVFLCVSANAGLWSGPALSGSTLSGVIVESDQPIIAVANEASWASLSPCAPNNGAGSFDKATSNAFNLND
jgi:hypothetical protein